MLDITYQPGMFSLVEEALHVTFALLARKLILCGELIAIIAVLGWRLDARQGLPFISSLENGRARAGDVIAASVALTVVLFVAFVRDYGDLGATPLFVRYAGMCLCVIATATAGGAILFRRSLGGVDATSLAGVGSLSALGIMCINQAMHAGAGFFTSVGALFAVEPQVRTLHGFAVILTGVIGLVVVARLLTRRSRAALVGAWDVFSAFALLALVQGFFAFRGVSAIYLLAFAALLTWRLGWRVSVAHGAGCLSATLTRQQRA